MDLLRRFVMVYTYNTRGMHQLSPLDDLSKLTTQQEEEKRRRERLNWEIRRLDPKPMIKDPEAEPAGRRKYSKDTNNYCHY